MSKNTRIGIVYRFQEGKVQWFNKGRDYYHNQDYDNAIIAYNQAIVLNPRFAEAYFHRGSAYHLKKGQLDRAIADYDQAIILNSKLFMAYRSRGAAYRSKDQYELAIDDYNQAIALDPQDYMAYYERGGV